MALQILLTARRNTTVPSYLLKSLKNSGGDSRKIGRRVIALVRSKLYDFVTLNSLPSLTFLLRDLGLAQEQNKSERYAQHFRTPEKVLYDAATLDKISSPRSHQRSAEEPSNTLQAHVSRSYLQQLW